MIGCCQYDCIIKSDDTVHFNDWMPLHVLLHVIGFNQELLLPSVRPLNN